MAQVTFYQLGPDKDPGQPAHLVKACELAAHSFRHKQRCLVLCQDKAMAEQLDELLWQLPADSFIPHNLTGEGPQGGVQVEIGWQLPTRANRPVLINLQTDMPEHFQGYQQIYDFVPDNEALRITARTRFKQYRAAGQNPQFVPVDSRNERDDG